MVEEAQLRNKHVAAHAHGTAGIVNAVEAGVTTIEHCSFAKAAGSVITRELDLDVVGRITDHGVYVCPTVSGMVLMSFRPPPRRCI